MEHPLDLLEDEQFATDSKHEPRFLLLLRLCFLKIYLLSSNMTHEYIYQKQVGRP